MPDRIDVVLIRGDRVVAADRIPIIPALEIAAWIATVGGAEGQLRRFVERECARGITATVLYRSPSQVVDFPHFQLKSAEEACDAALLSCSDALPHVSGSVACDAAVIAEDRLDGIRRWHVAVAADRDDVIEAIENLAVGAGLRFTGALPLDAAIVLAMMDWAGLQRHGRRVLRLGDDGAHGWLHLGMHSSIFLVRSAGVIRFLRRINLGLETVAASLTRPIHQPGRPEPVELGIEAARRLLFENGIPTRDQLVHERMRLHGSDVLPLMQPALQRLLVELRQSLRFGLDQQEREGLTVAMSGPGCALPRFVELLATELQIQPRDQAQPQDTAFMRQDCGDASPFLAGSAASELVHLMMPQRHGLRATRLSPAPLGRLRLLPMRLAARQRTARSRRWMWAGAAAAAALMLGQWFVTQRELNSARSRMHSLEAQARQVASVRETRDRVAAGAATLAELDQIILKEVGSHVDLRALLHELTIITPQSIRLVSIDVARDSATLTGSVVGYAMRSGANGDRNDLEQFMDNLKRSPLLREVVLRDVRNSMLNDSSVLRFSASFEPVSRPDRRLASPVASVSGEVSP